MACNKNALSLIDFSYSHNHNTGAEQKWVVQDIMLFKIFDWSMACILTFDWLSNYVRHTSSISVHLACSTDMVFVVIIKHAAYKFKPVSLKKNLTYIRYSMMSKTALCY